MAAYQKPSWPVSHVLNPLVALPTRLGISLRGSRILTVRGRKSGKARSTPVNLLVHEGSRYLVAPRGETQWVRNLRAAGEGELRLGRHRERVRVTELADADKPAVLRAYLQRWSRETSAHFDGLGPDASDEDLSHTSPDHPVFRID